MARLLGQERRLVRSPESGQDDAANGAALGEAGLSNHAAWPASRRRGSGAEAETGVRTQEPCKANVRPI